MSGIRTPILTKLRQIQCIVFIISFNLLLKKKIHNDFDLHLHCTLSNTYCGVFLFCFSSSCVPYVVSFSELSIFITPSVSSNVYWPSIIFGNNTIIYIHFFSEVMLQQKQNILPVILEIIGIFRNVEIT
jgi:hypothetical protein